MVGLIDGVIVGLESLDHGPDITLLLNVLCGRLPDLSVTKFKNNNSHFYKGFGSSSRRPKIHPKPACQINSNDGIFLANDGICHDDGFAQCECIAISNDTVTGLAS